MLQVVTPLGPTAWRRPAPARSRPYPAEKFEQYVTENGPKSSREGLLREHGPKPTAKSGGPSKAGMNPAGANPAVIEWVAAGRAEGMNRDELIQASRERSDFPGPRPLSGGVVSAIDAILYDRKTRDAPKQPAKRKPTAGGKRKRKIYEEIRTDGDTELRRLRIDIADATMKLEHMILPEDVSLSEEAQDDIATLYHDLGTLLEWTEMAITATVAQMGDMTKQRTIKKLRDRAQDPSSTPDERISATRLADKLQQKHRAQRLGQ